MTDILQTPQKSQAKTEEEAQSAFSFKLSEMLGFQTALPENVARRASVDPLFLYRLFEARHEHTALQELIDSVAETSLPKWAPIPTTELLKQASLALGRWAAHGFSQVSDDVKEKRRAACKICPHLREPSPHLLFQIFAQDSKTCGLCSCAIEKKIMLPTETCPVADAPGSLHNRWGELLDR
ncbi:hypothetical protein GGQ73_001492 [Rhizobium skierniewicense]|uniref:Uncharacterized protein n=2 Tax=Rhizobium skierniewicense TaxID=984260 RepID=A0A7W6C992_9HYPH|nr:hypothetical protein [Rhizobium skierniewicense]MBB3945557.1 hypothetical protein [Rhizobium skierniewicense]